MNKYLFFMPLWIGMTATSVTLTTAQAETPEVWGLDAPIITKFNFARDTLKNCTRDAADWRKGDYPNLPVEFKRLPIPGGGYQGCWYWDSCFMVQQLIASKDGYPVAEDAFSFFCWELDNFEKIDNQITIPHWENGHARSQMPLFIWMADSLYRVNNDLDFLKKAYAHGKAEMDGFWMDAQRDRPRLDTATQLNHNDTDNKDPGRRQQESAYEHGWDNSARMDTPTANWFRVLPVDLNAVLYFNEKKLATWGGILKVNGVNISQSEIDQWTSRAARRQARMDQYFYDSAKKFYYDYDLDQNKRTDYDSLAPSWLVWSGALNDDRVREVADTIGKKFIQPYNLPPVTLSSNTPPFGRGCVWSNPFSWSPVTYLMAEGFARYDDLTPVTEMLVDKFIHYHGGRAEKYRVDGSPAGVSILGWGMSVYFNMVQNLKLGFRADMTGHKITLRPLNIVDGMGGRFIIPKHEDVSITYLRNGTTTVGAEITSKEDYNLDLRLYFNSNTDISVYPVYVNGKRLSPDKYKTTCLNRDGKSEGVQIIDKLTPGIPYKASLGNPK